MPAFAFIEEGQVARTAESRDDLPYSWEYPDDFADEELAGRSVSGFRFLDVDDVYAAGWVPMEGDPPEYDPATHFLAGPTYTIEPNRVVRAWTVEPIPPAPEEVAQVDADQALDVELATVRAMPGTNTAELNAKLNALVDAARGSGQRTARVAGRPKSS